MVLSSFCIFFVFFFREGINGCRAVKLSVHLQRLVQDWVSHNSALDALTGALPGKASVGCVRGGEMDKKTSWGLPGRQPYLILDLHATIMAALLRAWLASLLDCEALRYIGVTALTFTS